MDKKLPVYRIEQFKQVDEEHYFYANEFIPHIKEHHFTAKPHKHDFYLLILFTKGHGTHDVDFIRYKIKPGMVFMLSPGQVHSWKLSDDIDGYIFFHTKAFYEEGYTNEKINTYPFFNSISNQPFIALKKTEQKNVEQLFQKILKEHRQSERLRLNMLHALVNQLYITLTRMYTNTEKNRNEKYEHGDE